jgi:hypothetical protein
VTERPVIDLPASPALRPGVEYTAALARSGGTLAGGPQPGGHYCVWLTDRGMTQPVIWPHGYTARLNPLEIMDPAGTVIAREGDTLIVGGGFIDVDPSSPCSLGQSSAFAINVIRPGPDPAPAPQG